MDTFFTPTRFKSCLFFKFLLIYSKPCLVQLPSPYSFQRISWTPLDYLLWRRSGPFVRNSSEYTTPWNQSESNSATYKKTEIRRNLKNKHDFRVVCGIICGALSQGLVTIHVNILSMYKQWQGRTLFFTPARFKSCLFFKFLLISVFL
jgi:hypothetical protein